MNKVIVVLVLNLVLVSGYTFAQSAVAPTAIVSESAVVAQDSVVVEKAPEENSIISALKKVDEKIPLSLPAWVLLAVTFLVELLMRFLPTSQPRSLLVLLAMGLGLIGNIMLKSSNLLDKVAQNIKKDK